MSRAEPSIAFLHPDLGLGGALESLGNVLARLKSRSQPFANASDKDDLQARSG